MNPLKKQNSKMPLIFLHELALFFAIWNHKGFWELKFFLLNLILV